MRRCPCIARNTKISGGQLRQRPARQIFPWPSTPRCGGEEMRLIVRDMELFVNREQVRASFCKNGEAWFVCVYASDLDPTAIGERWEAQHHHQLRTCLIRRILKTQE